ncbi:hypothetical protein MJT46_016418 [Ovis ammon polii x Ovis aries]|nr:hypothetical protein MJT46_016418 [Ovis ammon polii x Ovis aries]
MEFPGSWSRFGDQEISSPLLGRFESAYEEMRIKTRGPDKAGANPENIVHMIVPPGPTGYIQKSSLFPFDTKLCDEIKPDFLSFSFGLFPESYPTFTKEETEAQRSKVSHPKSHKLPLGSSRDRGFQRPPKALPNVVAAPSWVLQAPSLAQPAGPHRYLPMAPANRTKMHIHPAVMT